MHAELVRAAASGHHGNHGQGLRGHRQRRPAPDLAVGVGIDDVLQRRAECAKGMHARIDSLTAEHLAAQLESLLIEIVRIHRLAFPRVTAERRNSALKPTLMICPRALGERSPILRLDRAIPDFDNAFISMAASRSRRAVRTSRTGVFYGVRFRTAPRRRIAAPRAKMAGFAKYNFSGGHN